MANSDGCSSDPNSVNHALVLEGLVTDATTKHRAWVARNSCQ